MGAPKPGSTFQPTPAQGGKGGGKPMHLTPKPSSPYYFPNGPEPSAQALNQGKGQGVPMGGMLGGGGNPMQPQVQQLAPGQVPPQGGKGPLDTSREAYDRMMTVTSYGPGGAPSYEQFVQNRLNPPQMPQVMPQKPGVPMQPGQVPAQGGILGDLANAAKIGALPQGGFPQQSPYGPYYDANGRPTAVGTGGPGALPPGFGNTGGPLVKPSPFPQQPQVLPQKPMPANMAPQQGLAGLQNMLYGGKR